MLTLLSNEQLPFSPAMHLFLKSKTWSTRTPRPFQAELYFINKADVSWSPLVESWGEGMDPNLRYRLGDHLFGDVFLETGRVLRHRRCCALLSGSVYVIPLLRRLSSCRC